VHGVARVGEGDDLSCVLDESCFEMPPGYVKQGSDLRRQFTMEDEDELLQFAIQQSLIESGTEGDQVQNSNTFVEADITSNLIFQG
jgi:ankyrin repeat domain-containing protein 13